MKLGLEWSREGPASIHPENSPKGASRLMGALVYNAWADSIHIHHSGKIAVHQKTCVKFARPWPKAC